MNTERFPGTAKTVKTKVPIYWETISPMPSDWLVDEQYKALQDASGHWYLIDTDNDQEVTAKKLSPFPNMRPAIEDGIWVWVNVEDI